MIKNKYLASASIVALLIATGCQNSNLSQSSHSFSDRNRDYLSRHDGVTAHAGNQLAVNEAKMVSDPWKRRAHNTHLHGNGKRIAAAVERYENNGADEGEESSGLPGLPSGFPAPPTQ